MDILSTSTLFFVFFNFFLLSSPLSAYALHDRDGFINSREALEIIIGGGGAPDPSPPDDQDCPPPPPPPCPPPISEPSPIKSHPPPPPSPPPPPPPPSPPPPPPPLPVKKRPKPEPLVFENELIANAYSVIQRLKPKIKGGRLDVLKTWNDSNVCNYKGFFCDIRPDFKKRAVSGVNFNGFKFSGDKKSSKLFLKGFIDDLKDITFFHANSNFFVGEIPVNNLTQQPFFYELDLSNNKLPGEFPTQVLGAKLLTFFDIRFNGYYGPIPAQLFDQDIITAIFINNNNFTSDLPDNLGKTPAKYLTFASNQFTGRIPRSIGQAKKTMEEIVFRNNKFEGCLPYEIGFLENATLFDAGNNLLTGPIPLSFACLAKMELIYLADNQFYGPVPEIVCKLPKLGNFTLRNNFFTEVGPECKKLINKKILDVSNNCIPYFPNQKSREECEWFFKKPKQCGNDMSFKYIHCKNNWYLHPYVSNPTSENVTVAVKPKKSYAALSPDGRL